MNYYLQKQILTSANWHSSLLVILVSPGDPWRPQVNSGGPRYTQVHPGDPGEPRWPRWPKWTLVNPGDQHGPRRSRWTQMAQWTPVDQADPALEYLIYRFPAFCIFSQKPFLQINEKISWNFNRICSRLNLMWPHGSWTKSFFCRASKSTIERLCFFILSYVM